MKTEGLSINLATVRQQFGLKDGVEACARHGITAIAPWRDHVAGDRRSTRPRASSRTTA